MRESPAFTLHEGRSMRLLSLALVAGLFAVGFGYAQEKKPAEDKKTEKKAEKKMGKVTGTLTKIDGDKLTVTLKGDAGEKTETFTTNDKTKFYQEEAAPAKDAPKDGDKAEVKKPEEASRVGDKKPDDKKGEDKKPAAEGEKKEKKPAPKRTEIKLSDLKTGTRVAVMAGEDKVAAEVVVLPAAPKKEKGGK